MDASTGEGRASAPIFSKNYEENSLTSPEKYHNPKGGRDGLLTEDPPKAVVVCYDRTLLDELATFYEVERIAMNRAELLRFTDADADIGIVGGFGCGGPATALVVEELVAAGVETFLTVGLAGCLQRDVGTNEIVIADRAIRDEGTSYHYLEPEHVVEASESLVAVAEDELSSEDQPFRTGTTWTSDAFYRETPSAIGRYARNGVLTVEMEAATLFAVAKRRCVDAGALFIVSDYLTPSEWDVQVGRTRKDLLILASEGRRILEVFTSSVQEP